MPITLLIEIMPRPRCCKIIGCLPSATCYRPDGKETCPGEEVLLSLAEFESLRLADYAGLYQEDAAAGMNVSRQTFGRIVSAARKKVADALINGRVLRIEGEVMQDDPLHIRCGSCMKPAECAVRNRDGACRGNLKSDQQ